MTRPHPHAPPPQTHTLIDKVQHSYDGVWTFRKIFERFLFLSKEKKNIPMTHLDDHFEGEHSGEDIIKITQDLGGKKKKNT